MTNGIQSTGIAIDCADARPMAHLYQGLLGLEIHEVEAPWQPSDRDRSRIRIMLEPAGHPLCLFLRGRGR